MRGWQDGWAYLFPPFSSLLDHRQRRSYLGEIANPRTGQLSLMCERTLAPLLIPADFEVTLALHAYTVQGLYMGRRSCGWG